MRLRWVSNLVVVYRFMKHPIDWDPAYFLSNVTCDRA